MVLALNGDLMSAEGLDALRARVARDTALAERLRAVPPGEFVRTAATEASRLGLDVDEDDVRSAVEAGRRAWVLRWIA